VQDLLNRNLIEPAHSAWSSPVVLVKKKDGSWRFCVDYRNLSSVAIQDAYPFPRIDESLDAPAGSKYFSTLDLLNGYWQVPFSPDAQDKVAFITCHRLWKWKVLPFGLTFALAIFQRLIGAGPQWVALKDAAHLSGRCHSYLPRLCDLCQSLQQVFERL